MTITPEETLVPAAQAIDLDRHYTAEELLTLSTDPTRRYELKKGKLTVMSPAGGKHGMYAMRIGAQLQLFAEDNQLGVTFAAETGFKLESDPDTVLAPDASFLSKDRMADRIPGGYVSVAPDLIVEVVSPNDRQALVQDKVQAWLRHGVQLVWIVEPKTRTVTVYRPDGSANVLQSSDTLDGETVLPGFQYALGRLFKG